VLSEGLKPKALEDKNLKRYSGQPDFRAFKDWHVATCVTMANVGLSGPDRDYDRILYLKACLDGQAYEEVIIALYNCWVHTTTFANSRAKFESVKYDSTKGIIGLTEDIWHHTRNMVNPPGPYVLKSKFLSALLSTMRSKLFEYGVEPHVQSLGDMVAVAKRIEDAHRTEKAFHNDFGYYGGNSGKPSISSTPASSLMKQSPSARPSSFWKKVGTVVVRKNANCNNSHFAKREECKYELAKMPAPSWSKPASKEVGKHDNCFNYSKEGHFA
jgi:hypothetical protein